MPTKSVTVVATSVARGLTLANSNPKSARDRFAAETEKILYADCLGHRAEHFFRVERGVDQDAVPAAIHDDIDHDGQHDIAVGAKLLEARRELIPGRFVLHGGKRRQLDGRQTIRPSTWAGRRRQRASRNSSGT